MLLTLAPFPLRGRHSRLAAPPVEIVRVALKVLRVLRCDARWILLQSNDRSWRGGRHAPNHCLVLLLLLLLPTQDRRGEGAALLLADHLDALCGRIQGLLHSVLDGRVLLQLLLEGGADRFERLGALVGHDLGHLLRRVLEGLGVEIALDCRSVPELLHEHAALRHNGILHLVRQVLLLLVDVVHQLLDLLGRLAIRSPTLRGRALAHHLLLALLHELHDLDLLLELGQVVGHVAQTSESGQLRLKLPSQGSR